MNMIINMTTTNAEYQQAEGVSDMAMLQAEQTKPAQQFESSLDTWYLPGIDTVVHYTLILVDIEKLTTGREIELVDEVEVAS